MLTAALGEATVSPPRDVARSEVASATTYSTRIPLHAYQSLKLLLEWRAIQLLYCTDNAAVCIGAEGMVACVCKIIVGESSQGVFLLEDALVNNVHVGFCLACSVDARVPHVCYRNTRLACTGVPTQV